MEIVFNKFKSAIEDKALASRSPAKNSDPIESMRAEALSLPCPLHTRLALQALPDKLTPPAP